jgi:Flp pilus assembly protein TadG
MGLLRLRRLARDAHGGIAVEYALILPALVLALLGGIWLGLLGLAMSSLDLAVQSAARCMAVDANACATPTQTQTYAQSQYTGPDVGAVFTASATGCGHTVSAQGTFSLDVAPGLSDVPLNVSACYP